MSNDLPQLDLPILSSIVGLQFARGNELIPQMNCDSRLCLRRNPGNKYDKNAIEVHTLGPLSDGTALAEPAMLGHMPRGLAAEVAPVMDSRGLALAPARLLSPGEASFIIESWPEWIVQTAEDAGSDDTTEHHFASEAQALAYIQSSPGHHALVNPNDSI